MRNLPAEILLTIFEVATYVPEPMSREAFVDPFASSTSRPLDHPGDVDDILAALRLRAALPLVCKHWHALATPLLYRCLIITDAHAGFLLRDTLVASCIPPTADPSLPITSTRRPALGTHTEQLVLTFFLGTCWDDETRGDGMLPAELRPLGEIFACLPRLTTLWALVAMYNSKGSPRTPTSRPGFSRLRCGVDPLLTRQLMRACGATLQRVYLGRGAEEVFDVRLWTGAPKVRSIVWPRQSAVRCNAETCVGVMRERRPDLALMTVNVGPCHKECGDNLGSVRGLFPNLRTVLFRGMDCGALGSHEPSTWRHFLAIQGPLLTAAHIDLTEYGLGASPMHCLNTMLAALRESCPDLTHLYVYVGNLDLLEDLESVPSVTHLGIYCATWLPKARADGAAGSPLDVVSGLQIPSLQVVRFMSPGVVPLLREHVRKGKVAFDAERISQCSFRIEDHSGALFCDSCR
ncbi:hypothetical protein FA95DRAFT_1562546 [Auriscalpium vulgare]|uniref:Uncharacterized protein n=1 Tax=Auriscalpium vulgare TaxID=40419 RepID=A0ACB8RKF6_9AGAM|nr:hypothetical protein FA95DRAFT_1562546 [Auriscalpium vulgare]